MTGPRASELDRRAEELYASELDEARRFSDRLFARLMLLQLAGAVVAALIISPRTWIGTTSVVHTHVWASIALGALIASAPLLFVMFRSGSAATRYVVAAAQMLFSALLIHVSGGRIETHFHVFGSLAFLAFYRDHRVLLIATAVTAIDHFVRGVYWPQSVFGVLDAGKLRWLEHAAWIVFEVVFLSISIRHTRVRSLESNRRAAELEVARRELATLAESQQLEVDALHLALDRQLIVSIADRSGKITSVNKKFCEISGYEREELVGHDHRLINSGRHPKKFWVDMWKTVASGVPWRGEVCNQAKDGSLYWVDSTIAPILCPRGEVERYLSIRFDITSRKLAELENQRLASIIASTDDAVFSVDLEGRITTWNRGAEALFGVEAPDAYGEPLSVFLTSRRAADTEPSILYNATTGRSLVNHETVVTRRDGRAVHAAFTVSPLRDEHGEIVGASLIARDITAQKRAEAELRSARERAEAASAAKSEFLANMSHEIRTPMTAILGYADLLGREDPPTEDADRVAAEAIKRNGAHLLALINDILDLSRIEAGKLVIDHEPVAPGAIAEDATTLLAERAREKGLDLETVFDTPIPSEIRTDPVRLRQILVNLLGNAVKFTDRGRVVLRLTHDERERLLHFRVEDTGVGVPHELQSTLFDAFTQADASTTRRFGGSGLGLRISQRLARLLGGDVRLERSDPKRGSVFTLELPAPAAAERVTPGRETTSDADASQAPTAPPQTTAKAEPALGPLAGARILYIEDGPDNQRLVSIILSKSGAEVEIADNGAAGLAALCEGADPEGALLSPPPFDLVLTDMQMPIMDGYTAVAAYRRKGGRLPVIALTAHAMRGDHDKCLAAGCDDYASKPVDRVALVALCSTWLEREAAAA